MVYYAPPADEAPAHVFLYDCPVSVRAQLLATLDAVAEAPPPQFSGGGYWEAMHGDMAGYYEVRASGPKREQFRLFCLLDNGTSEELLRRGLPRPAIAVITGMRKQWRTAFGAADYKRVRAMGTAYRESYPRHIVS